MRSGRRSVTTMPRAVTGAVVAVTGRLSLAERTACSTTAPVPLKTFGVALTDRATGTS